ncbi:unnamed protein product [Triticum turgidum subsp. durum]|uniref:Uncharacterized protein n=1 Tax=Triticum turgidum subsp. durum TaxID=4567 RepID=A0A9R1NZK1_TRITD|nr:unnamed protein product [Triticum turgidum subsp. durum]
MALVRNLAALLCVVLASLAFVMSRMSNAAGDLSNVKRDRRVTGAVATEAPASSLVESAADAHNVFDDMPQM